MLLISLVACLVLLGAFDFFALRKGGMPSAVIVGVAGTLLALVCGCAGVFLPALVLTSVLMALAGGMCWYLDATPRTVLKISVGVVVVSHLLLFLLVALPDIQEGRRLRQLYPVESMTERLAYETRRPSIETKRVEQKHSAPPATRTAELVADERLTKLERDVERPSRFSFRNYALRKLHEGTVQDFINSPGFGITRGIRPRSETIELPKIEPIAPPVSNYVPDAGPVVDVTGPAYPTKSMRVPLGPPPEETLAEMHENGVTDFVNPQGFGYIEDRNHVTGFQAHHFRAVPSLTEPKQGTERWQVQTLELVSLLRHEKPVAYVSQYLPRMDELRDAPTRPLDGFEEDALVSLRRGEDLKVNVAADQIRVLGSIRALKQCLACHEVQRGELLGAFSYTLRRAPRER